MVSSKFSKSFHSEGNVTELIMENFVSCLGKLDRLIPTCLRVNCVNRNTDYTFLSKKSIQLFDFNEKRLEKITL